MKNKVRLIKAKKKIEKCVCGKHDIDKIPPAHSCKKIMNKPPKKKVSKKNTIKFQTWELQDLNPTNKIGSFFYGMIDKQKSPILHMGFNSNYLTKKEVYKRIKEFKNDFIKLVKKYETI